MVNLISTNKNNEEETVLTQFETEQGWRVKIDLKTKNIWVTTLDLETLLETPEGTWKDGRTGFGAGMLALRGQGLSENRKELKLAQGGVGKCYDQDQLYVLLENANCNMFKQSKKFGVYTAILQILWSLRNTKTKTINRFRNNSHDATRLRTGRAKPWSSTTSSSNKKDPLLVYD